MNAVVRSTATLMVTFAAMLTSTSALAVDSGDIVIVSLKGEVIVSMSGAKRAVRAGSVLDPPALLRTGRDGTVELRQGATTLSVGPETVLEFPALEKRGAPIDRIVQPRGNVFYNVGKREGRKLRIETPYLVGVVKGTQFNVAALDETTTISLFEGLLEVRAADESGVVDLRAGEIASRQRDDKGVSVIKMDGVKAPAAPARQPAGNGSNNSVPKPVPPRAIPHAQDRDSVLVDSSAASVSAGASVAAVVETAGPRADVGPASVDTSASPSVSSPAVEVSTTTPVDVAPASVDTGTAVSVSAPAIEVSTSTTVDAAPASVDTGAGVSVSAPAVEVSASTAVDAGPTSIDTGTSVNVGTSSVDVSTTTTVDAGPVGAGAVDGAITAGITTGPALTTDLGVDVETRYTVVVGASNNQQEVTVGSANAADAVSNSGPGSSNGNGNGNQSVEVTVDLGVDLGLEDTTTTPSTDTTGTDSPGHGPPADVVDMLDGLLRRRGKK